MRKILKNLKIVLGGFLSFLYAGRAQAQGMEPMPMYGVGVPVPLYGVSSPISEVIWRLAPWIASAFLVLVAIPLGALVWYKKRGGQKRWPAYLIYFLIAVFLLILAFFVWVLIVLR